MNFMNHGHTQRKVTKKYPDLFRSVGVTQALEPEEGQQLLRNTDAGGTSAKE